MPQTGRAKGYPIDSGLIFSFASSVLVSEGEQQQLLRVSMPEGAWVSLRNREPILAPMFPGYSFLTELCPGICFYSLARFLLELILYPSY